MTPPTAPSVRRWLQSCGIVKPESHPCVYTMRDLQQGRRGHILLVSRTLTYPVEGGCDAGPSGSQGR